jgi:hypothetical protein
MIGQSVEDVPMEAVIDLHGYLNQLAAAVLKDEQEGEQEAAPLGRRDWGALHECAKAVDKELTETKLALDVMTQNMNKAHGGAECPGAEECALCRGDAALAYMELKAGGR